MSMDKIEHVVLLMMENRSFDSLLGSLYDDKKAPAKHIPALKPEEPAFEGLYRLHPQEYENVDATGSIKKTPLPAAVGLGVPNIAPGEKFLEVNTQLFEKEHPGPQDKPTMKGYVRDFTNVLRNQGLPSDKVQRFADQVMQCYRPVQLPVLNGLAEHYAVCDMWFSSVPSQTNPNRAFALCGTSMGLVDNGFLEEDPRRHKIEDLVKYKLGDDRFKTKTIFNALEEGGKTTWKIFGRSALLQNKIAPGVVFLEILNQNPMMRVLLEKLIEKIGLDGLEYLRECSSSEVISDYTYRLFPEISKVANAQSHFAKIDDFHAMARAGQLPNFSYIEPDWTIAETGTGAEWKWSDPEGLLKILLFQQGNDYHPPGNLDAGENLVKRVYNSLIANRLAWEKTLLLITFDEPVGSFDHVPPPRALFPWGTQRVQTYQDGSIRVLDAGKLGKTNVPGTASQDTAAGGFVPEHNFDFGRYGGRVPTILVSPLVEKGSVFRSQSNLPFDHTSIIRTILEWRGVPCTDFGIRAGNAPTFDNVVTLSTPRTDEREVRFLKLSRKVGEPVHFYDRFYLKSAKSGKYVSGFTPAPPGLALFSALSTDPTFIEYFPRLASTPSAAFYFQYVYYRPWDVEIDADGKTEVRLVSTDDGLGAYNVLGKWKDSDYCYYFNDYLEGPLSDQESWILEKSDKSKLRFGDRVGITNKAREVGPFPLSRLIESSSGGPYPDYLTMQNWPGEGVEYWTIEPIGS